jgi:RNA polymerase sigma-70 factor (ECF subfamily)
MSSLPITDLLSDRVDAGDFAELYVEYAPRVLRYLQGALRDAAEAEDVMHEVFLKAYRAIQTDSRSEIGSGWLFTVARTTAIDHTRRRARNHPVSPAFIVDLADRRRQSEREPRSHWISEPEVNDVLIRLPQRQQEIIVLRYVMGCSHADVARILDCTEISVRKAHQRALQSLAHELASSDLAAERMRHRYHMTARRRPRRTALGGFSLLSRRRLVA